MLVIPVALLTHIASPWIHKSAQFAALGSVTAPVSAAPSVTGAAPAAAQGLAGVTAPASAITGGGCYENNIVSVSGGSIPVGATPVPVPKGCPATVCFIPVMGGTPVCMLKTAAQGLSLGVGSLITALTVGNLARSLAQQQSSGSAQSETGGSIGYGASTYGFGGKPTCSTFAVSSGVSHVQPQTTVTFTWILGGGTPESQTITPTIGIIADEPSGPARSASHETPSKTTVYTLTVSNRSGSSTCKTIVYVAPRENSTSEQQQVVTPTTVPTAHGVSSIGQEVLNNPLSARTDSRSYDDVAVVLVEKKQMSSNDPISIPTPVVKQGDTGMVVVEPFQTDQPFFDYTEEAVAEPFSEDRALDAYNDSVRSGAFSVREHARTERLSNDALFASDTSDERETHISGMLSYDDVPTPSRTVQKKESFFSWLFGALCVWCN